MHEYDFGIFGAGIIGLSIARKLLQKKNSVILFDKKEDFGLGASTQNSGVIHSGAYYENNSLKHILSIKGKNMLYDYCKKNKINHKQTGKLFISLSDNAVSLNDIYERAKNNGLDDLRFISRKEITNIDEKILAKEALLCPSSGIVNKKELLCSIYKDCINFDKKFSFIPNIKMGELKFESSPFSFINNNSHFTFKNLINSTGLESPNFIRKHIENDKTISPLPIYGGYLQLKKKLNLNTIIYTSLTPGEIIERVDATPTLDGNIIFGPSIDNTIPNRENLIRKFYPSIKKYLDISKENLDFSFYGIRPKAKKKSKKINDFYFHVSNSNSYSLINFESPAFTSCFAIADYFYDKILCR